MARVDDVFRALADPRRRTVLDALRERDGQTLGELERVLPDLTRFGVMRHLRVLEAAGLLTTRRQGRQKFHYLNPVPVRLIHDRWTSRYDAPFVDAMVSLKSQLEEQVMSAPAHVHEVYIRTTPEELWAALTDPEQTRRYWYGALNSSDWTVGSRWVSKSADGEVYLEGEILEIDPPRRLVHSWHVVHEPKAASEPPSRVTWEIEAVGESVRLTVTHDQLGPEAYRYTSGGYAVILSGLKTLLETGEPLAIG